MKRFYLLGLVSLTMLCMGCSAGANGNLGMSESTSTEEFVLKDEMNSAEDNLKEGSSIEAATETEEIVNDTDDSEETGSDLQAETLSEIDDATGKDSDTTEEKQGKTTESDSKTSSQDKDTLQKEETQKEETPKESTQNEAEVEQKESNEPETPESGTDLIASLQLAQKTSQLIVVSVEGSRNTVTMYQKDDSGSWNSLVEADASIGKNGLGKSKEGDRKTPRGTYTMSIAFGKKDNPGTGLPYTKVDDSWYWVDDVNSAYYNKFVSTNDVTCDWNSAEHISAVQNSYNYAIAIDYNTVCAKGAGSAIFLHCKPTGGAGCIAISEDKILTILQNIKPRAYIIIDDASNIKNY